jgi:hypothetical protein
MKKRLKRIIELLEEISSKLGVQQQSQPGGPGQPPPDDEEGNG